MNKIKHHFKENISLYITFIIGIIVISFIFYLQEVAPFGKNSLLTIDFFHQYGPMLGELYDRVKEGTNLVYSFSMGMGLPFIKNFLNYLSSPFNVLIFLFKRSDLLISYSIIIGLKVVSSAITLGYYLNKKFNNQNIYFIPLSILYAFSAFFTAYYWNIMWLDAMVFLPIIILGIEHIVDKNKYILYILSLAIMLISNYFVGYMICLFSVIYFIGYLLVSLDKMDYKYILKKIYIFGFSSLLAGGIAAVMLIPLFLGLNSISATSDMWPTSQYYAFTFLEYLANHFTGVKSTVFSSGISNAANISVGILPISLLLLFIINPKIKIRIKILYICLILFFILSFFYAPLDFIWHAFHVPNDLPYRYSFIYSFVLIVISAYSLYYLKEIKVKFVITVYFITILLLSLLHFLNYKNIDTSMIIFNFILITLYFIIYLIYINFIDIKKLVLSLFILTAMVEIIVYVNHEWEILQYIDDFYADYSPVKTALNHIESKEESNMFRIERTEKLTLNDPSWYNYYGQTTFSSMAYENLAILQNNLGMPGNNINSYYYKQNTPIYDIMFNIKYFIGETWDIKRYSLYYNENDLVVFKNNNNAGLMFGVNNDIKQWNYINDNPFDIQNDFIEKSTGIKDVMIEMTPNDESYIIDDTKKIKKYTYNNPGDNMYFYSDSSDIDFIIINESLYYLTDNIDYHKMSKEQIKVFDFKNYKESYILNTRTDQEEFIIYVGYSNYKHDSFYAYTIDDNKYIEAANKLKQSEVLISEFNEKNMTGFINTNINSTIFTSIPYDEGWKIKVNGKDITTYKIGNSLLGFDVKSGDNHIILQYKPKGIMLGAGISSISILICIALSSRKKELN